MVMSHPLPRAGGRPLDRSPAGDGSHRGRRSRRPEGSRHAAAEGPPWGRTGRRSTTGPLRRWP